MSGVTVGRIDAAVASEICCCKRSGFDCFMHPASVAYSAAVAMIANGLKPGLLNPALLNLIGN
jgi:hypothetical protein